MDVSVLIVSPEEAQRRALGRMLGGHHVVEARSASEAMRWCADADPAVALVDVTADPDIDLVARLRPVPVLVTPGSASRDLLARGWEAGAADILEQPLDPRALQAKMRTFAALWRGSRETQRLSASLHACLAAGEESEATIAAARADLHHAQGTAASALESQRDTLEIGHHRDTFISVLAHDLRVPLTAILLNAHQIVENEATAERCRALGRRIVRSANRMNLLVADVLDFARGQLGAGIPVHREETDLAELVDVAVDDVLAGDPDRRILTRLAGDLRGWWDSARIEQALSNLLANALQHGDGAIVVGAKIHGDDVVLDVCNRGRPIPAPKLRTLFSPFQGSTGGGLGLGLYIVREIVRAHGGHIEVTSSEAGGTRFTITLPRHAQTTTHPASLH